MMKTEELKALVAEYPNAMNYNDVLKGLVKDYSKATGDTKNALFIKLDKLIDAISINYPRFYKERNDILAEKDIPEFLKGHVVGDYYCHFEYEDYETGNREADISETFNTLKECYEEALNIISNYKRVDALVIKNDEEEVVMSLNPNSDKYEWVKGGDDW